jgi:hypothetical protein
MDSFFHFIIDRSKNSDQRFAAASKQPAVSSTCLVFISQRRFEGMEFKNNHVVVVVVVVVAAALRGFDGGTIINQYHHSLLLLLLLAPFLASCHVAKRRLTTFTIIIIISIDINRGAGESSLASDLFTGKPQTDHAARLLAANNTNGEKTTTASATTAQTASATYNNNNNINSTNRDEEDFASSLAILYIIHRSRHARGCTKIQNSKSGEFPFAATCTANFRNHRACLLACSPPLRIQESQPVKRLQQRLLLR